MYNKEKYEINTNRKEFYRLSINSKGEYEKVKFIERLHKSKEDQEKYEGFWLIQEESRLYERIKPNEIDTIAFGSGRVTYWNHIEKINEEYENKVKARLKEILIRETKITIKNHTEQLKKLNERLENINKIKTEEI